MNIFARKTRPSSVTSSMIRGAVLRHRLRAAHRRCTCTLASRTISSNTRLGRVRLDRVRPAGRRPALCALNGRSHASFLPYVATSRVKYSRAMPPTRARVADIHGAQAAGRHAAQVLARLDDDDRFAHPRRLHRRDHAARRAAVDANIRVVRRRLRSVKNPGQ